MYGFRLMCHVKNSHQFTFIWITKVPTYSSQKTPKHIVSKKFPSCNCIEFRVLHYIFGDFCAGIIIWKICAGTPTSYTTKQPWPC